MLRIDVVLFRFDISDEAQSVLRFSRKIEQVCRFGTEQAFHDEVNIKQLSLFVFFSVHLQVLQEAHKLCVGARILSLDDGLVNLYLQLK